jgi:hypothetical protein
MPLADRQIQALQVLSSGGTYQQAADAAKVDRRTVIRWAKLPEFKEQLGTFSKARAEAVSEVIKAQESVKVESLVPKALNKIQEILEDPTSRRSDQLRAAEIIGKWAGLGQVQNQPESSPAEQNLKNYLDYLAVSKNSNGKLSSNHN